MLTGHGAGGNQHKAANGQCRDEKMWSAHGHFLHGTRAGRMGRKGALVGYGAPPEIAGISV